MLIKDLLSLYGKEKRRECAVYAFIPQEFVLVSVSFSPLPIPWTSGGTDMSYEIFFTLLDLTICSNCYFESHL